MVGTPLYMSPEQYNSKKYGFKSDIWAFGCCLYEMCNLKHAFEGLTWNAVALKVLKGIHNPVNSIYSKELRGLIDQMLSVNPKNRPTIATILEKPFIKKKVASYIYDFMQTYKSGVDLDAEECQIDILKEQAEKLGVFNNIIKEINAFELDYDKNSNNIQGGGNKYVNYLKKKQEEKKKLEDQIMELELQKKQIYANLKSKVKGKVPEKRQTEKKKQMSKFEPTTHKKRLNFGTDSDNDNLKIKQQKRPESSIKKSSRKYSGGNDIQSDSLDYNSPADIKDIKKNKNTEVKKIHSRPVSGIVRDNQNRFNTNEDSIDEVLETIREEKTDNSIILEKNKMQELTQEIVKMREYLEKTQNKIEKIEKIIEKDGYDNDVISDLSEEEKQIKSDNVIYTKEDTDGTQKLQEQIKFLRK
jgi:hypothetical protein